MPTHRRPADRKRFDHPLRNEVVVAVAFGLVVIANAVLAIVLIWIAQVIGWWEVPALITPGGVIPLAPRLRPQVAGWG